MWNFLFQPSAKSGLLRAAGLSAPSRRRSRRFAAIEQLESRALLSATEFDPSPTSLRVSEPLAAEIVLGDAASVPTHPEMANGGWGLNFNIDLAWNSKSAQQPFPSEIIDEVFSSIAQGGPNHHAPVAGDREHSRPSADLFSSFNERPVELRFAETGQVVAVGSSKSVQDSDGLTISDDSAPATYLSATDADGQTYSRLVFVTRATRSAPTSDSQTLELNDVVVTEAELSEDFVAEDLETRPDLHDFETALDSANPESESPSSQSEDARPLLAATTRTLRVTSTRAVPSTEQTSPSANIRRKNPSGETSDDSEATSDDSAAMPVFDPTTRNVVLSVCVLGALARANARRRRRQKVAFAQ